MIYHFFIPNPKLFSIRTWKTKFLHNISFSPKEKNESVFYKIVAILFKTRWLSKRATYGIRWKSSAKQAWTQTMIDSFVISHVNLMYNVPQFTKVNLYHAS